MAEINAMVENDAMPNAMWQSKAISTIGKQK